MMCRASVSWASVSTASVRGWMRTGRPARLAQRRHTAVSSPASTRGAITVLTHSWAPQAQVRRTDGAACPSVRE
jgi:hypothetical protein